MKIYLFLLALIIPLSSSQSQDLTDIDDNYVHRDTICIQYDLLAGDTLVYKIETSDSIMINFASPILRIRKELIEIVVDSISSENGHFYLTHTMKYYKSTESGDGKKNIERNSSPWIGQKAMYSIDAYGKRYSYSTNDSNSYILAPGGAFTPVLFTDLGIYCKERDLNWIVKSTDELPENGVPFPLFNHTSLYKIQADIDTLGQLCRRVEFVRTGTASYSFYDKKTKHKQRVTHKTNGFALLDISIEKMIPIHLFYMEEQKLTIHRPSGKNMPGQHWISAKFTLVERKRLAKD